MAHDGKAAATNVEFVFGRDIFEESIAKIAERDIVLDVGGGRPFSRRLEGREGQFSKCRYLCLDAFPGFGPHLLADAMALPFRDGSADAVICDAVMEHVPRPHDVADEMLRVLRPGGVSYVYVPFLYPYHGNNEYKDYFRFTEDSLIYLFRGFSKVTVNPLHGYLSSGVRMLADYSPLENVVLPFVRLIERPIERKARANPDKVYFHGHYKSATEYSLFLVK